MSVSPHSEPADGQVPACYRHPDREAYVRCNRCERVICPDCMREAAVGFHCVDCLKEGQRSIRQPRTAFGGRATQTATVTWTLLAVIGAGFLAQLGTAPSLAAPGQSPLVSAFSMWGYGAVHYDQWYRLLTSAFLHGSLMHLLFNGFALYILGPQLERWLGHSRFLALWVLSALGGSVLSLLAAPYQPSIGASGAIFGMFGAVFILGRRLRLDTRFVLFLLGINLLITFLVPIISWTAHIGGLLTGGLLALAYAYLPAGSDHGPRRDRTRALMHGAATAGCALLIAALSVAGALLLPPA